MQKIIWPLFLICSLNCGLVVAETQDYEISSETQILYELRTYTANPGKLEALEKRFKNHTMALFEKHGIRNIQYWKPEESSDTLIYLVAHPSKLEAAINWKNFGTDPVWQEVYRESIADGRLVKDIQRVFMTETPYSP